MLEFADLVLKEIRKLRQSSEEIILNGTIADMERYRFMMGRLEGLKLAEESVKSLLKARTDDDGFLT
jgi:23S rRNA A1618 N6-methylase RlmF